MRHHHGMSLIEVIVAVAVFVVMTAMVMEVMIGYRNLAFTSEDGDVLEEQATNAQRAISRDFANSGWFYCKPGVGAQKFFPQVHTFKLAEWQPYQISPPPEVVIPIFNPTTLATTNVTYTATVTQNLSTSLGDAVVFARLQPEGSSASDTPQNTSSSIVDFNAQPPVRMDKFPQARAVGSLVINPSSSDQSNLSAALWETTATAISGGIDSTDLYEDAKIRLFCYRVIPDPATGRGMLVRYYSNPGSGNRNTVAGWTQDMIIATDVLSMHVYTYEMSSWYSGTQTTQRFDDNAAAGLSQNQIRFVIQFAKNMRQVAATDTSDITTRSNVVSDKTERASTTKILQFTIGLRSITNAIDQ